MRREGDPPYEPDSAPPFKEGERLSLFISPQRSRGKRSEPIECIATVEKIKFIKTSPNRRNHATIIVSFLLEGKQEEVALRWHDRLVRYAMGNFGSNSTCWVGQGEEIRQEKPIRSAVTAEAESDMTAPRAFFWKRQRVVVKRNHPGNHQVQEHIQQDVGTVAEKPFFGQKTQRWYVTVQLPKIFGESTVHFTWNAEKRQARFEASDGSTYWIDVQE